jgi:enoyl-CoA hydratase
VDFGTIQVERGAAWLRITLNRPDKLNPLDWGTLKDLRRVLAEANADASILAVIITGAGRAFSAGGDLAGYVSIYADPVAFRGFLDEFAAVNELVETSEKIVIAAVNGHCVAGGLELMLACDVVFAAETARIGDGHVNFAQIPGAGGSQRLARAIGRTRALAMMLSGRLVDGREAERIGLVTETVPADRLLERAEAFAAELATRSPTVLANMKRLVREAGRLPLAEGLKFEMDLVHAYATGHPDATEGLHAFAEKRRPTFQRS